MLGQYVYLAVRQRRSLNLKDCVATNLPKLLLFPAPTCSSHRREQTSRAACWQILARRSTSGQSKKLSQTKILADSGTHCIRFTRKEDWIRKLCEHLWRRKLAEQLPQLQPHTFQRIQVVTPVAPARGNRQDGYVQEGDLSQVL